MGHRRLVVNGLTSLPSVVVETAERKTQSEQSRDPTPPPVLAPVQGVSPPKLWPQMWRWGSPGNALGTEEEEEEKRGVYWEELGLPRDRLVEAEMLNGSEGDALLCTKLRTASVPCPNSHWGHLQRVSVPARSLFPL